LAAEAPKGAKEAGQLGRRAQESENVSITRRTMRHRPIVYSGSRHPEL